MSTPGRPNGESRLAQHEGGPESVLSAHVVGIGLLGPGMADWPDGAAGLRGSTAWSSRPVEVPAPQRLAPTERRRAGALVKASIVVGDEACRAAGIDPATLATVFTSSTGEPANCHALCEALAAPGRMVSPTRFTNSVHNAAGGYWHIAVGSPQPSTSLSAFDGSFGAGLLEAMAQCVACGAPVLLVACDVPYPKPLHAKRPLDDVFGVALVLAPTGQSLGRPNGSATVTLKLVEDTTLSLCGQIALDELRIGIPAARSLPLLQLLAAARPGRVWIEGLPGMALQLDVSFGSDGVAE